MKLRANKSIPLSAPGPIPVEKAFSALLVDPSNYSISYDCGLCEALSRQGSRVTLACCDDLYGNCAVEGPFEVRKMFYQRTHAYAKGHSRGTIWRIAKAGEHVLSMNRLTSQVARSKPTVVHFQWLPLPFLDRVFLPRLRRAAPLILTLHNTSIYHGESAYRLFGLGLHSAFSYFDAVIVHTEYSKKKAIEQGWIEDSKIHVIPHGVMSHYRKFAAEFQPPPQVADREQIVLFFGTLKQYKGVDVLIRAFAQLPPETLCRTKLHIVGYPAMDVAPLRGLALRLGVDQRIKWELRFVAESEIPALFGRASVVVLPYREIDQSGVLLTAIALDKAVVATQIGGISETIKDGIHGFIVPPGEPGPMSEAIAGILDNPDRRKSMETAVGLLRDDLSWEKVARKTLELYSVLCKTRSRERSVAR